MPDASPLAGWDWTAVSWGGPDERTSEICSYCDTLIPDDDVPLMLWTDGGWGARFCEACQGRFWCSR